MIDETVILCGSLFGAVTLLTWWVASRFGGRDGDRRVRDRLSRSNVSVAVERQSGRTNGSARGQIAEAFARLGQAAAKPFMPDSREKQGDLRRRLSMAGIYSPSAIRVMTGFKVILLFAGLFGGAVVGLQFDAMLIAASLGGLLGYLAPRFWLTSRAKAQQRALENGLPDALDLMVVCVEAGLAVDAAMQRVGEELAIVHPRLSRELDITHMETRVGLARSESLRNLGVRTGCAALQSLASMLIQADRFGTSIASALKVHADSMRVQRQQKAEELAAKASVKMSFPLVLFIFPATFIVLAGPTIVELMNSSLLN